MVIFNTYFDGYHELHYLLGMVRYWELNRHQRGKVLSQLFATEITYRLF